MESQSHQLSLIARSTLRSATGPRRYRKSKVILMVIDRLKTFNSISITHKFTELSVVQLPTASLWTFLAMKICCWYVWRVNATKCVCMCFVPIANLPHSSNHNHLCSCSQHLQHAKLQRSNENRQLLYRVC